MTIVAYRVAPNDGKWQVTRDGEPGMSYVSQEAAYEVAVAEASGDLRTQGMRSASKSWGTHMSALATDRPIRSDRRSTALSALA